MVLGFCLAALTFSNQYKSGISGTYLVQECHLCVIFQEIQCLEKKNQVKFQKKFNLSKISKICKIKGGFEVT